MVYSEDRAHLYGVEFERDTVIQILLNLLLGVVIGQGPCRVRVDEKGRTVLPLQVATVG